MTICHAALYGQDIEKLRRFYEKYFGAVAGSIYRNTGTGFSSYSLSFGGECRLELMHRPDVSAKESGLSVGYVHIAFSVGGREKVDSLTEKMRLDGYEVVSGPRTTGDGYYESCVRDPEGNLVEITE